MTTHRAHWLALLGFSLAYVLLFVGMYPPLSGIEDEVGFVNQALVWSRGAISSEVAGFSEVTDFGIPGSRPHLMDFVPVGSRHLPGRHPGRSLIVLPFLLVGGVLATFYSGLLIHLVITFVGALLLVRLGRSPFGAILVLFHPTLALYSRTIMGDEAAGGFLLLAALLAMNPGLKGAVSAGISVGLASLMRYHAGLALPIIAASIALNPARDHRRRDGLVCLVTGGLCGIMLIVYNFVLYHAFLDPVGGPRGQFGLSFVLINFPFYLVALISLWPGMLLAPLLDRSPIKGLSRGVTSVFLIFFSAYYFHDHAGSPAETLVVGLRLMQVALPIWIISYVLAINDRFLSPIRKRVDPRIATLGGLIVGLALLGGTGLTFQKHQSYLLGLKADRDAIIAEVPSGSVIVTHGSSYKLFGIPAGGPAYRWLLLMSSDVVYDHSAVLDSRDEPWFLAILTRGQTTLPAAASHLIHRYRLRQVESTPAGLMLYRADSQRQVGP